MQQSDSTCRAEETQTWSICTQGKPCEIQSTVCLGKNVEKPIGSHFNMSCRINLVGIVKSESKSHLL
jgi:hypothetical protein